MSDIQQQQEALINALPMLIEMPVEDELEDPMFRVLFGPKGATVAELRAAVGVLRDRITEDLRQAVALSHLLDGVVATGADDDARISDICARHKGDAR